MANRTFIYLKTSAPTVNDDTNAGYKVGDEWLDTTNNLMYKAKNVTAGAAVWAEFGGDTSGGLTVADASVTTGNVTGVEGTLHNLDVSGMTADRDFNLPTPTAAGKRIGVRLSVGDATYALLLKIDAVEWSRIFITGEIVIFVSTGTGAANWAIEQDGRIPCTTKIQNTGAQAIANSTLTVVTLDELDFDNASCADTGNNRITIRRTNRYLAAGGVALDTLAGNAYRVLCRIRINNATYLVASEISGLSGCLPHLDLVGLDELTATQVLNLYVFHNSGSSEDTYVTLTPSHLEIMEIFS